MQVIDGNAKRYTYKDVNGFIHSRPAPNNTALDESQPSTGNDKHSIATTTQPQVRAIKATVHHRTGRSDDSKMCAHLIQHQIYLCLYKHFVSENPYRLQNKIIFT
jgi:hypothetical protein